MQRSNSLVAIVIATSLSINIFVNYAESQPKTLFPTEKVKSFMPFNKLNNTIYEKGSFILASTLYGVTNKTGMVVVFFSFTNTTNVSMGKIVNATALDLDTGTHDGIVDVTFGIENVTLKIGEKFLGCAMLLGNQKPICVSGYNAPTPRYEYVSLWLNNEK